MELRCDSKKHGEIDGDFIEIRCRSRFCGYSPGIVVIHRFDFRNGEFKTRLFKEPPEKLEVTDAA